MEALQAMPEKVFEKAAVWEEVEGQRRAEVVDTVAADKTGIVHRHGVV